MSGQKISFKNANVVKINLMNGLIGIIVGVLLSGFLCLSRHQLIPTPYIFLNILYSFCITLSITNTVLLYEKYFSPTNYSLVKFLAGYYSCSFLGMVIGTQLAYLIGSFVLRRSSYFNIHLGDYFFNGLLVFVVSTLILLYLIIKINSQAKLREKEADLARVKQLKTEAELETLQAKVNPHFLYNALNSIASLTHQNADKAEEMTLNLSKLFRYSINQNQDSLSTVQQEMEIVETYLAIEKVRFGDRIDFNVDVPIYLYDEKMPRFLIQPLVENALKHGLKDKLSNGLLEVSIKKTDLELIISVSDNGVDFPAGINVGYGLQSTYDRLTLLYGNDYEVKITNAPIKQIRIILPILNKK